MTQSCWYKSDKIRHDWLIDYYYFYYTAGNAQYVIAVKRWIAGAVGLPWWSSPSQVPANIYGVCGVWVCLLLCLVIIIAVPLGNKVIFNPLSLLPLQATVNSCNSTQIILKISVPEIRHLAHFSNISQPLFVIVATHLSTSKGWKPQFGLCPGSWTSDLPHGHARMNMHARNLREGWLFNQLS